MQSLPDHTDADIRAHAVRAALRRSLHPAVRASIRANTDAQQQSLAALSEGVCVVTGQQAGLFGGPLYTLHKAASAIVDARALQAETGVPCAPVFWLQDEDHDFAEIASIALLDRGGALRRASVEGLAEEAGRSVAHRRLGPSVHDALALLETCIDGLPHAQAVVDLMRGAYRPEASPASAATAIIERLFAAHGLLVVDPAHPGLAGAAQPVHDLAFREAGPISVALQAQVDALQAAGRPAPVHIRPDSPLSFVHPDGPTEARYRIEPADGGFRLCGTDRTVSKSVATGAARSTSALLRPILQDTWLPTAAYVGGPGELAYLAQMPPLWLAYDLPIPLVVPRGRAVLLDSTARRLMDQLGVGVGDLAADRDALLAALATAGPDLPEPDALLQQLTVQAEATLQAFSQTAEALDPGLAKSVHKTARSLNHAATKLVDRYRAALAGRDGVLVDRLDRLLARVHPGAPQERVHTWAPFAARVGIDTLVNHVIDGISPFDPTLVEISL